MTTKKRAISPANNEAPKTGRRKTAKRELIATDRDKRFVRRSKDGRFNESDDVGRSLAQDRRKKSTKVVKAGQGDKGDRSRPHANRKKK